MWSILMFVCEHLKESCGFITNVLCCCDVSCTSSLSWTVESGSGSHCIRDTVPFTPCRTACAHQRWQNSPICRKPFTPTPLLFRDCIRFCVSVTLQCVWDQAFTASMSPLWMKPDALIEILVESGLVLLLLLLFSYIHLDKNLHQVPSTEWSRKARCF